MKTPLQLLHQLGDGFAALRQRDQVIAIAALAAVLALGGNLVLLKPQLLQLHNLDNSQQVIQKELGEVHKMLVVMKADEDKGIDPLAAERATLAEFKRQINTIETFLDGDDSTVSQVGMLVRGLIRSNPGLKLVSLKTQPGVLFYSPPEQKEKKEEPKTQVEKYLASLQKKEPDVSDPAVVMKKPIYKHGIEVQVMGTYPVLMSYLEEMQKFPKRIFWSEALLDAKNHRQATLKLLVYTLSDQPNPPLN